MPSNEFRLKIKSKPIPINDYGLNLSYYLSSKSPHYLSRRLGLYNWITFKIPRVEWLISEGFIQRLLITQQFVWRMLISLKISWVQRHLSIDYQNERITIKPQGNQLCRLQLFFSLDKTPSHISSTQQLCLHWLLCSLEYSDQIHTHSFCLATQILRRRATDGGGLSLFNQRNVSHEQV